ncbi:uncharacterized protein LOC133906736 [Phragmites australis]|uniref:uncharacterized protein LOC133906736 n=1 Tax=Phragmites australis TaxID=29695 RepID=UPI002D776E9A|nr:uncharacterized protein LOC133906736 [Phragmites australis]
MSTTASNHNLAGMWFGELASALQGRWQEMAASHGEQRPRRQQVKLGGGLGERNKKAVAEGAAGNGRKATEEEDDDDVGRCGGTMSDATVRLLFDRFAPS